MKLFKNNKAVITVKVRIMLTQGEREELVIGVRHVDEPSGLGGQALDGGYKGVNLLIIH